MFANKEIANHPEKKVLYGIITIGRRQLHNKSYRFKVPTWETMQMKLKPHWPMEEQQVHWVIWQPMVADERKDLQALLMQLTNTTAFYSHELLNSANIQKREVENMNINSLSKAPRNTVPDTIPQFA